MTFTADENHNSIIITFTDSKQAEFMMKRFCNIWDEDNHGKKFCLDLLSLINCKNMFCVSVDPWHNCRDIDGFEQFKQFVLQLSEGIDG